MDNNGQPVSEGVMRVTFVGVGEAFDEHLDNTSLLVEADYGEGDDASASGGLLLDCGFTAASAFWRTAARPMNLDGVVLSHFHGDHWFGLPALLIRFVEEGRTRDLTIVGQAGVEAKVDALMDLAYPGSLDKRCFEIRYLESASGGQLKVAGFGLSFALGDHSAPCLGVRVDQGGKSLYYSGDGRPTADTLALATGVDLIVHEAYALQGDKPGHGTVTQALDFARNSGCLQLALVHLNREARRDALEKNSQKFADLTSSFTGLNVRLSKPGQRLNL